MAKTAKRPAVKPEDRPVPPQPAPAAAEPVKETVITQPDEIQDPEVFSLSEPEHVTVADPHKTIDEPKEGEEFVKTEQSQPDPDPLAGLAAPAKQIFPEPAETPDEQPEDDDEEPEEDDESKLRLTGQGQVPDVVSIGDRLIIGFNKELDHDTIIQKKGHKLKIHAGVGDTIGITNKKSFLHLARYIESPDEKLPPLKAKFFKGYFEEVES